MKSRGGLDLKKQFWKLQILNLSNGVSSLNSGDLMILRKKMSISLDGYYVAVLDTYQIKSVPLIPVYFIMQISFLTLI